MNRIYKITFVIFIAILALWQLPWGYRFVFKKHTQTTLPFMLFSPITHEFSYNEKDDQNNLIGKDLAGRTYTSNELDSVLPLFYYRQLADRHALPDTIAGEAMPINKIKKERFIFRSSPDDINGPITPLYMLLESEPKRLDFSFPTDFFRCTNQGLEFVDMKTNKIKKAKSEHFTKALKAMGCEFPIIKLHSNPSVRKAYDNGYLLVDSQHQLFQLKMTHGEADCQALILPNGVEANQVFITEYASRKSLGFVTDMNNKMYLIDAETSATHAIDIPGFDPTVQDIMIIGNPLIWTVRIQDSMSTAYYGLDAHDYHLYKKKVYPNKQNSFIGLHFTSWKDGYVRTRWN